MAHEKLPLQQKLSNFLLAYRNATHATTNQTPAMLFMKRLLRSRLYLIQPNLKQTVQDRQMKQGQGNPARATRSFTVDETVLARSYRGYCKWVMAVFKEQTGPLMYKVELPSGTLWWHHVDQLRKSGLARAEVLPTQSADSPVTLIEPPPRISSPPRINVHCPHLPVSPPSASLTETSTVSADSKGVLCEEKCYPTRIHKPPQRLIETV